MFLFSKQGNTWTEHTVFFLFWPFFSKGKTIYILKRQRKKKNKRRQSIRFS
jgi:hypothetical protein